MVIAREGDLIENCDRAIFDVKGLVHPADRVVAFIRYFSDSEGARTRKGQRFGKVYSFPERFKLLESRWPQYIVHDPVFDDKTCEVPVKEVKAHYKPVEKFCSLRIKKKLDPLQSKALLLITMLKEDANIPWSAIGISGSILADLHTASSDIDPIVYGSKNCRKVYSTLKEMLKKPDSLFKSYGLTDLRRLFDFRSKDTATSFDDFVRTESNKALQGSFLRADYFVRFVKGCNEVDEKYGDVQYKNVGSATIDAVVVDDSEAIFTPCIYQIANVRFMEGSKSEPVEEIVSFRGRFCEQAKTGERIVARGKIEQVTNTVNGSGHFRLLVGNRHEDFIIPHARARFR